MQASAKIMQPLSIYKPSQVPDWTTYWPNMSNVYHREKWINGMYPTDHYLDWVVDDEISIQLRITVTGTENLIVYKYNESTETFELNDTIIPTEITPVGWVSEQINRYNWTPTETGIYYINSASADLRTNTFIVHSSEKMKRRLVKIDYYNSFNDYGMIFFDGDVQRYSPTAYFTGMLVPDAPGNEISAFETDRGEISKQRSTPTSIAILKITDVHYSELERINLILACDNLMVNGITYQNNEPPQPEMIEGTDLFNVTCKLIRTNYEY